MPNLKKTCMGLIKIWAFVNALYWWERLQFHLSLVTCCKLLS